MKIHSLKQRWMLNSVLVLLAVVFIGISAISISVYSSYYTGIQRSLEAKAKTATDFFSNYIMRTAAEYYQSAYRYTERFDERDTLELQFINTRGQVEVSTYGITAGSYPGTPDIAEAIDTKEISVWMGRNPATDERIIAVSSPMIYSNGQVVGVMRYVSSLRLVDEKVTTSILVAVAVGAGIMLLVLLANMYFIRGILTPIREVTVMTRRIADGGYGGQIEKKYNDEIGEMVDSINEMSMEISQSDKMKSEFISSVSHELRTPLTAITGWGETLLYDESMSEDSRRGVAIILKEARRLTTLVEELLDFTRIENGRFTVNLAPTDVEAEVRDAIATYEELFRQDGIVLEYYPSQSPLPAIPGDALRLRQVFLNVLDNAAKYGREGKRIIVCISYAPNYAEGGRDFVQIQIRDFGPGIPEDELPHVKYKFYKGSSKERGSGIGLAVCDEIVRLHNGILNIANAADSPDDHGCVVTILLPVSGN